MFIQGQPGLHITTEVSLGYLDTETLSKHIHREREPSRGSFTLKTHALLNQRSLGVILCSRPRNARSVLVAVLVKQ